MTLSGKDNSGIPPPLTSSDADYSLGGDVRRLEYKHRREIAFRFMDAWREVREETGYGTPDDAVSWATRIVEGRGG